MSGYVTSIKGRSRSAFREIGDKRLPLYYSHRGRTDNLKISHELTRIQRPPPICCIAVTQPMLATDLTPMSPIKVFTDHKLV
jgi:hypothetical protein